MRTKTLLLALALLAWGAALPAKPPYKVYGYLYYWSKDPISGAAINLNALPWNSLTHLMDAFGFPAAGGTLDLSELRGAPVVSAAHSNGTRAILSLGGQGNGAYFPSDVSAANRSAFVASITNTVKTIGYDGVDIDWEFPGASDKANFMAFMQALYNALKAMPPGYDGAPRELSFFISTGDATCGVDWANIKNYCDVGIISGYSFLIDIYNGPMQDNAPYTDCSGTSRNGDVVSLTNNLIAWGLPASKLALGCPLFGIKSGVQVEVIKILGSATGYAYQSQQKEATCSYAGGLTVVDTVQSYCDKINWALSLGMKGIGLWEISQAYPPTDPLVAPLWSTIGGNAACLALTPSPTRTGTPPTATPSPTPSPTVTVTLVIPAGLVDHVEDGDSLNLWGGYWSVYGGLGASNASALNNAAPGYGASPWGGLYAAQVSGTADTVAGAPNLSTNLQMSGGPRDLSAYNKVAFWFKGTPGTYRLALDRQAVTDFGQYGGSFSVGAGWTYVQLYFITLTQPSWAVPKPMAWNDVTKISWTPAFDGAYSISVDDVQFLTDSVTPTLTPTPPSNLLDTVEDGDNVNNWGGLWTAYAPAGATVSAVTASGPGYPASPYGALHSVSLSGTNTASSLGSLSTLMNAAQTAKDISAYNLLSFWVQATPGSYRVNFHRTATADYDDYGLNFTVSGSGWAQVQIPFGACAQSGWGAARPRAWDDVIDLAWFRLTAGPYQIALDDLNFLYVPPTPTATLSPTRTVTATPSSSRTWTPSLTMTPSGSCSPTPSPSSSQTRTALPSGTPSATSTPTPSPSISPTWSVSPPWTHTSSPTLSATPTISGTWSPSPSFSASGSPTVTGSRTQTSSPSFSASASPSATPSGTLSCTRTSTPVASAAATATSTASRTRTPTSSVSASVMATGTPTRTRTPSPSATTTAPAATPGPASATASPTIAPTSVPPPAGGGDALRIIRCAPAPQPQRGPDLVLAIELTAEATELELSVYTKAMTGLGSFHAQGPFHSGWNKVEFKGTALRGGLFYYRLRARSGDGSFSLPCLGTALILR